MVQMEQLKNNDMNKSQDTPSENQVYDLMTAIRILTRSSLLFQNAIAEKMGLNVTDAECIDFLMEMGSSTAGELANVTRLTTGAITNVIDRLEKAGFVKREKDPDDRRKVIVVLIPERHETKKKYYDSFARDVFTLFSGYSKKELKLLLSHSEALNSIYEKHREKVLTV
jgi:MarR family transcriptional regulator, organic hydroperoxide resistance regulator